MSFTVNIHEAKTHLSKLLQRVLAGEEIVIARSGVPVARIVPIGGSTPSKRVPGSAKNQIRIAPDFDAPLPDDLIEAFESN